MKKQLTAGQCYSNFWSNYFDFNGVATRPEFWWPVLFNSLISLFLQMFFFFSASVFMSGLFSVIIFIPGLSVLHRRYHDIGKSAWEFWIGMFIGLVLMLFSMAITNSAIGMVVVAMYFFGFMVKTVIDLCQPSIEDKPKKSKK